MYKKLLFNYTMDKKYNSHQDEKLGQYPHGYLGMEYGWDR